MTLPEEHEEPLDDEPLGDRRPSAVTIAVARKRATERDARIAEGTPTLADKEWLETQRMPLTSACARCSFRVTAPAAEAQAAFAAHRCRSG